MKKELLSAFVGALVGGGISLYSTHLAIDSQKDALGIQISESKKDLNRQFEENNRIFQEQIEYSGKQLEKQFDQQRKQMKHDRLFTILSEILTEYGDVTNVIRKNQKNSDFWYRLNSYALLLGVLGEKEAERAVVDFYKKGNPKTSGDVNRKEYYKYLKSMGEVFDKSLQNYN